jgi:dTDP-4-amino-4,6-dideoxygalactose transaminase
MIRIAQPQIGPEEEAAVLEALRSGQLAQGPRVAAFEEAFASYAGVRHAIALSSASAALLVALKAHGIGEGDEVLVPTFTFAATANAVLLAGARPVLIDITADSYTVDVDRIEVAITPRTRAIMPVHLYGHACDMTAIMDIAARCGLVVIEDAAQATGASWQEKNVGSFGTGCFSFYATKNMTTGEGGMLSTNDNDVARQARLLRDHGEGERYRTDALGYNFRMTEVAAALGIVQLAKLDAANERRRTHAAWLTDHLTGVSTPIERPRARHVYHQYTVRAQDRDRLQARLGERDVEAVVYYPRALHQQPLYRELGIGGSFPVAEGAVAEVLSLPVHPSLSREDLESIASAVNDATAAVGAERG